MRNEYHSQFFPQASHQCIKETLVCDKRQVKLIEMHFFTVFINALCIIFRISIFQILFFFPLIFFPLLVFLLLCYSLLRWPTTVTTKPNAHSKLQSALIKFKSLTANYKSLTANYKSPTANSNRSQQIKVAHSKFKLLTANYKLLTPLGVFGYLQPAVQLV